MSTVQGGGGSQSPIILPPGATVQFEFQEDVVTDRTRLGIQVINADDITSSKDAAGVTVYHIIIHINVLASAPSPQPGSDLSLNDLVKSPNISGTGGLGNPWFSGSPVIAFIENYFEMLAIIRQEQQSELNFEIGAMVSSLDMARDSAALIKLSAQKEAAMQIMGIVMGAVKIASSTIKLASMSKGCRKALANLPGPLGKKFKDWNAKTDAAQGRLDGAETAKLGELKADGTRKGGGLADKSTEATDRLNNYKGADGKGPSYKERKDGIRAKEQDVATRQAEVDTKQANVDAKKAEVDELGRKEDDNLQQQIQAKDDLDELTDARRAESIKDSPDLDKMNDLDTKIAAKNKDIAGLEEQGVDLTADRQAAQKDLTAAQTDLTAAQTDLTAAQTDLTGANADLAKFEEAPAFKSRKEDAKTAAKALSDNEQVITSSTNTINTIDEEINASVGAFAGIFEGISQVADAAVKGAMTIQKGEADAAKAFLDACREIVKGQLDSSSQGVRGANENFNTIIQNFTKMIDQNYQSFNATRQ